jgi:hypothetical protein
MHLYLLGGHQKTRWIRPVRAEHRFDLALIVRVDTESACCERIVEYVTPNEAKPQPESSSLFTSASLCGNKLYACTYSEVLVFEVPFFRRIDYISSPLFNSVHHVTPTPHGTLLVANTGLDMVMELTTEGSIFREWDVMGGPAWTRFSQNTDYRKLSTKPHRSHPNFVFQLQEDIWVTRLLQKDAICLTRRVEPIRIDIERPHDGVLHQGSLYFTTVDGHLVIANAKSRRIDSTADLKAFREYPFTGPAWCRGVLVVSRDVVCVGFTRIRKTKLMQAGNWIKHGFREIDPPTHIAIFNLAEKRCLSVVNLEPHGINILFGILPAESAE